MKLKIATIVLSLTSSSFAATLLDGLTGTIAGTTTTWTTVQTAGTTLGVNASGFALSATGSVSEVITITFSAPVDFDIISSGNTHSVFSNNNNNNNFTADAGAGGWTFTAGAVVPTRQDGLAGDWYTITGNTIDTDDTTGGSRNNGDVAGNDDWGVFSNTGVTTFTWSTQDANSESFHFCVEPSPVPEPASAALLGLGGLAFSLRRSRK